MSMKRAAVLICILASGACSDFPKDNAETLKQLQAGREMRVGAAHNPPWVIVEDGRVEGLEPALVTQWAESLGTKVRFVTGPTHELVEGLYGRELDILVMGLTDSTPHSSKLALSQPYLTVRTQIGVAPDKTLLADWSGQKIAVDPARLSLVAQVKKQDAVPVPLENGGTSTPIIAGYDFELLRLGLKPAEDELATERRVIAAMPGEGALLLSLDQFLQAQDREGLKNKAMEALR